MKTRRTKVLLSLLAIMAAGFAVTNAYIFRVDNWDPFGTLNLSNLIIKASPTSNTGMELSGYKIRIKTENGQLNVHKICDENGDHCTNVESIYNGDGGGNGISAGGTTGQYCFLNTGGNLLCNNDAIEKFVKELIESTTPGGTRQLNTKDQAGYVATGGTNVKGKVRKVDNDGNPKWLADDTSSFQLQAATGENLGGIKIGYQGTDKNYPVELDSNNKAYVHVPRYPGEGLNGDSEWEKATFNQEGGLPRSTTTNILHPKEQAYNVWLGVNVNSMNENQTVPNYKLRVSGKTQINGNTTVAPTHDTTVFRNVPDFVVDNNGIKMFGGINFYRLSTINNQTRRMRGLSVNGPILAGTSGNYIYMYANGSSSGDQFRSYEIMGNNELAVGTRAGAFLYFTERTGKYAQVITGGGGNGTNTRSAQIGVPVNSCPDERGAAVSLPNLNGGSSECTTVNINIPAKTARNYVTPNNANINIYNGTQLQSVYQSLMVGVNTNDPQATLDVNGSIRVGSNCVPIGMKCDDSTVGTMMYLERKNTYRGSIVVCIADGVTTAGKIKYKWYDIMNDIKGESLTGDLGFANEDGSCLLPKPNRGPYPVSPEQYES